jgi:hypothetical protein
MACNGKHKVGTTKYVAKKKAKTKIARKKYTAKKKS